MTAARALRALAAIFCATLSMQAAQATLDHNALSEFVDGFMLARMEAEGVAGVTLAIVHDGDVILARGYGKSDVDRGLPVEPDATLFRPGSISKTFVWTAVMQLVEQGRLDLDTDIRTWLPELPLNLRHPEPITLSHLMAHTPGFEESVMGHLFTNAPEKVMPLAEYLTRFQPAQVRPPGTVPAYSNFGTALAGLIVANVTGMPFEDYVERYLFEPLGMRSSTFREPWGPQRRDAIDPDLEARISRGYRRQDGAFLAGDFEFIGSIGPAGALSTTAQDMARWMLVHLQEGELDGMRILEADTARRMQQRHHGLDPELPGMAHGFIEGRVHGWRSIGHGGGTVHFLSDMQMFPELGFGVFISTNTAGGQAVLRGFVRTLVERHFEAGPDPIPRSPLAESDDDSGRYAGAYLSSRYNHSTLERMLNFPILQVESVAPGRLAVSGFGATQRYHQVAADTFRDMETGTVLRFVADERGRSVRVLHSGVPVMVFDRVGPLGNPRVLLSVLAACLLVLLCVPVGAWLRRGDPPLQTDVERWSSGLAVGTAVAWLGFAALLALGLMSLAGDLGNFFYAIPNGWIYTALAVGLIGAGLTVLSALLLIPVWGGGDWSLWRRLRHSGVVAACVVTLLLLREFNAIGFNLMP